MSIELKRVDPVDVTEADKNKQESKKLAWVNEAMAGVKADLKQLTYEVNPFIKKVEGKAYWEYDIDKVRDYLNKLQNINNFQDIAKISWEKTRGAYTVKWIMAVQIALKALWVAPDLTIDWVLATQKNFSSSETVKAIRKFQVDNGLDVTGVPYGSTIKTLIEKLGGAVSGTASESSANNQNVDEQISSNQSIVSGVASGSTINNQKPNQTPNPTSPVGLEQQNLSSDAEKFVAGFVNQLKKAKNAEKDILAVEKALRNYLKEKDFSEFKRGDSKTIKNGKYYYDGVEGENSTSEIWTFENDALVDWVKIIFSGESDKFQGLRIVSRQDAAGVPSGSPEAPQPPIASVNPDIQDSTEWKQVEVSEKTDEELTKEVINFFSQADPKNPQTTIFATLARWNGKDFEELGRVLSKLSLDGLTGKTSALRELMRNLNQIVTILNQNKRFMLFNGAQRKNDVLEQITGIISKVWGIPEGEIESFKDLADLVVPPSKGTSASSSQNGGTPDKKDQANGVVSPQPETKTTQEKNLSKLERQQQLAAEKAKKEAEKKAKELAEREKKAAEKRRQEEEKKKRLQKEKVEDDTQKQEKQTDKPSGGTETAAASKEFTRYSKLKDLGALGKGTNPEFVFNKGVLQNDGNGDYILMDGEKYYAEKYYENNDQKRDLKYFYVTTNTTAGVKIQFWKVENGFVQPDFEL